MGNNQIEKLMNPIKIIKIRIMNKKLILLNSEKNIHNLKKI